MNQFRGHAKSLSELYVFYQRLNTDGFYPTLGKYVQYASLRILNQTEKYSNESDSVYAMAKAEFRKEKMLLEEKFGVSLNMDYYTGGDYNNYKEVIDAINSVLNLKNIYERNKALIKNTNGQRAVFSVFHTYFMQAWDEMADKVQKEYAKEFAQNGNIVLSLENAIDNILPDILDLGIRKMLDGAELESGIGVTSPELKNAYKGLISEIGNIKTEGSLANQLYHAYELDKLKDGLIEEISQNINFNSLKGKVRAKVDSNIYSRGGLGLEAIETAIFQQIGRAVGGKAIHSGQVKIKADNILTIGINPSLVQEALEKAGKNRNENIKAFSELGEKISKLNDGFIVYSSDKNYTLNKNFGGFSSGKSEKISVFLERIYKNNDSFTTLLGAINQLGEGAMLAKKEADFERLLAQDVAYLLFDDYTTIGEADVGGRSIHVMNLNGIIVPLSFILHCLGEAIDFAFIDANSVKKIVDVNIKVPKIEFETQGEQLDWQEKNPEQNAWDFQRQQTLTKSTIQAKILKNFKSIIANYL